MHINLPAYDILYKTRQTHALCSLTQSLAFSALLTIHLLLLLWLIEMVIKHIGWSGSMGSSVAVRKGFTLRIHLQCCLDESAKSFSNPMRRHPKSTKAPSSELGQMVVRDTVKARKINISWILKKNKMNKKKDMVSPTSLGCPGFGQY